MYIVNNDTGEGWVVNNKMARVKRLQRRIHAWATAIKSAMDGGGLRLVMVGLTYRPGEEWQPNHMRDFVVLLHKKLGLSLKAYAWAAELQERGAVHYHFLMLVDRRARIPFFDKAGWWVHGSTSFSKDEVRSPFYLCSYTAKANYQKFGEFPQGLRMFAVWVEDGLLSDRDRWIFDLSVLPVWLSKIIMFAGETNDRAKRGQRGESGWFFRGDCYQGNYEVINGWENSDWVSSDYYIDHPVKAWA